MTKTFYKLEVIPEGQFHATVKNYELSSTSDGKTTFLCITFSVKHHEKRFEVQKYFIVNPGRNQKIYQFIREMGFLHKNNKVSYDELIGAECSVDLYYNSDGKLIVGDVEPIEEDPDDDVDFTDEEDEE